MNRRLPGDRELSGDAAGLDEIEVAAAEWVLRREEGLSAGEEAELARWLKEDPSHARVFSEMADTSRLLDSLGQDRPVASPMVAPPATARWNARRAFQVCAAMAAMLVLAALAWRQFVPPSATADFTETAATPVGGAQDLPLPDGSLVELNTDTAIEVRFSDGERRVRLVRGEAYFSVAKDPSRPFWVEAGPVAVRAVGTAFNVRLMPGAVNVIVTEGRVRVSDATGDADADTQDDVEGAALTVGQLARLAWSETAPHAVTDSVVITEVEPRALKSALAWQEGRMEFFESRLDEVVAEFNRYNTRKIVIADPSLAARRFGGAFASHEAGPLLELLEQSFGVRVEERGHETVLRLAP